MVTFTECTSTDNPSDVVLATDFENAIFATPKDTSSKSEVDIFLKAMKPEAPPYARREILHCHRLLVSKQTVKIYIYQLSSFRN